MDILLLNWKDVKNPTVGGAEIIAFEFARRLVNDGHTVTFFSRSFPGGASEEHIDGVRILRRGGLISVFFHAFYYYRSLKKKPDKVIDMINTIGWLTPLYVEKKRRIAYLNQLAQEVWFYEFPPLISHVGYLYERIEYLMYKDTPFLCYSESTKQDLIAYGIPKKNISLFPLGLDHNRYIPAKNKSRTPLFLFVARLVRMKKADLCIEAMKHVVKKYPESRLAIIGNGPDEKRLEALVEDGGLRDHVQFVNKNNFYIDKKKGDSKVRLMQESWCLLLPSVKEGWGMVVTEAAACGTPAIVSGVSGLRDSVVDGKTGIVLSKKPDAIELADAIIRMIEDTAFRKSAEKEAIQWGNHFSWEKSYTAFKKLVTTL